MAKNSKNILIIAFLILGSLLFSISKAQAADFVFSDDFSSDWNLDRSQSNFVLINGSLYAPDNFISSTVVSTPVIYSSYNIGSAKLEVSDSVPTGGRIVYLLSNDDGATWTQAQLGNFANFSSFGKTLRWSAVIARQNIGSQSPSISSVKISARESDTALSRNNDSKRISDLSIVSQAISEFYKDYGVYPHVSSSDADARWDELMALLLRNRNSGREPYPYLYASVNDPLKDSNDLSYDYKDLSPNDYILAATLEMPDNYALSRDIDGNLGGINCNDPVYCIGVLRSYSYSSSSNSGVVLGTSASSTSSTTNRTTTAFGKTSGLDLDNIIALSLNNLIGEQVFRFGDYNETGTYNHENTTITNQTNTNNNSSKKTVAMLPLSKNNGKVEGVSIAKAAGVSTGVSDSLVISFILSGLATLVYAAYAKTNLFKKRDAMVVIKKGRLDKNKFNFV